MASKKCQLQKICKCKGALNAIHRPNITGYSRQKSSRHFKQNHDERKIQKTQHRLRSIAKELGHGKQAIVSRKQIWDKYKAESSVLFRYATLIKEHTRYYHRGICHTSANKEHQYFVKIMPFRECMRTTRNRYASQQ